MVLMMTTQLTLSTLGALSGTEKAPPIQHGDILVTKPFGRVVVLTVSDNINGAVYVAVRLDNGSECVVLEREVLYRSTRGGQL
jgi:hypothetical protein